MRIDRYKERQSSAMRVAGRVESARPTNARRWRLGRAVRVAALPGLLAASCTQPSPPPEPRFVDISEAAGIHRVTPTYDAAVADFDGDGRLDLHVGNHGAGAVLLRNAGDGTFDDLAQKIGIERFGDQHGSGWTDYDNDGRLDLLVSLGANRGKGEKQNLLYRNDGHAFREVGAQAGISDPRGRSRAVAWLDFDRDGNLDLFIANNFASPNRLFRNLGDGTFADVSESSGIAQHSANRVSWADYDSDGDPDLALSGTAKGLLLLRNEGGTRVVDVTEESGLGDQPAGVVGTAFGDYDNDGVLDLYVAVGASFTDVVRGHADDRVTFAFSAHDGPSGFDFELAPGADGVRAEFYVVGMPADPTSVRCGTDLSPESHEFFCPSSTAGTPGADAPPFGYLLWREPKARRRCADCPIAEQWHLRWNGAGDYHLTGILHRATHPEPVALSPDDSRGGALYRGTGDGRFERVDGIGLEHDGNSQAVQWADVNNDGWLDLYVVDSGVDGAGGLNRLFVSHRGRRFVAAPEAGAGPSSGGGRGCGAHFADFDADGRLDLFLTNGWGAPPFDRGPYYLLRNVSPPRRWLAFDLVGVASNRPGLGAWVEVLACGERQVRYHDGAASYLSQSIVPPHVGLGDCATVDRVTVRWPSGQVDDVLRVDADQILRLVEGSS